LLDPGIKSNYTGCFLATRNKIATAATNGSIAILDVGNGRTKIGK
jgi:hypothetical protein